MKKTTGILLTLILSSQLTLAAAYNCTTDGNRIDCHQPESPDNIMSYRFGSIISVQKVKRFGKIEYYMVVPDFKTTKHIQIDEKRYEKITDYMEDSN